jgi:hypothetical protein
MLLKWTLLLVASGDSHASICLAVEGGLSTNPEHGEQLGEAKKILIFAE